MSANTLEDFDDIGEATATAPPSERPKGNYPDDLKTLKDGNYEFGVRSAAIKTLPSGTNIVEFVLELVTDGPDHGRKFQHAYFLNKKDGTKDEVAIGRLNTDLETLGFDVKNWTKAAGRPWSAELAKALKVIPGVGFKAKKATNKNGYANLYVNERAADDARPAAFGPEELKPEADPFNAEG